METEFSSFLSNRWHKKIIGIARIVAILLVVLIIGSFILATPHHFQILHDEFKPYELALHQMFGSILRASPSFVKAILLIGLSNSALSIYFISLELATMFTFTITAVIIFWRKPNDWMPVFASIALLALGTTIFSSIDVLEMHYPTWALGFRLLKGLGFGAALIVFYVFPTGYFAPAWTRIPAILWGLLNVIWPFFLTHLPMNSYQSGWLWLMIIGFGSGIIAQVYRYKKVSTPVQRQQTKWTVFGLMFPIVGGTLYTITYLFASSQTAPEFVFYNLIARFLFVASLITIPFTISSSIMGHRLWDIDPLINNTMVYGAAISFMGILYFVEVVIFQYIFRIFTGQTSTVAVAISTLIIVALTKPFIHHWKLFIDRRFYREKVDARQAFIKFAAEVRMIIDLPDLLKVLINRIINLLYIAHGAVFLRNDQGQFELAKAYNLAEKSIQALSLSKNLLTKLQMGETILRLRSKQFPLLVPLTVPQTGQSDLIGVLALGPRLARQKYARSDRDLLMGLADQAGTAIYVAQLIQAKENEAHQKEIAERYLEAHQNSPLGRAELFAEQLLTHPEDALVELYQLAQTAEKDPNSASLINNLPAVLETHQTEAITKLAYGFNYLFISQFTPEVLAAGLRKVIYALETNVPQDCTDEDGAKACGNPLWPDSNEALGIYQTCQMALEANSIANITELLLKCQKLAAKMIQLNTAESPPPFFASLGKALIKLKTVIEALHAYERVNTTDDKLAYLANTMEQLRHVDHLARTELTGVDRPIIRRIVERWLIIATEAMSDLQTSAKIVCQLLTRHTRQENVISLALNLRNEGRGSALNVQVELMPSQDFKLIGHIAPLSRLVSNEEAQVQFRVQSQLDPDIDQFRIKLNIRYTDPRGPDQIESYGDIVYLLAPDTAFKFIPNPYVVGTPLQSGSPLFFGRQDVVARIKENLNAGHRNNLVLIGQRRTGKTSLLKQLQVQLGEGYLPVYVDGQTLGLDPGLPNFFLTLATEITFALEDCDYEIDLPELEDFANSPASVFERKFLVQVRNTIGQHRHLLILLDEFEELEAAVRRGNIDPSVFGFLRHLIQHSDNLSVIFCGTHRLEELASDYWNILFNISLYRHIGFLEKPEAMRLIKEPVTDYGMRYDDLALDKIWRVTAGHPYFLQLFCHSLVNYHNKTERNYITVADVNTALDEIMASGEAHFIFLWTESTLDQRLVLTALSRIASLSGQNGQATPAQITDYLAERGLTIDRQRINDALHHLVLRDILKTGSNLDGSLDEVYRWELGLLGLWIEKYQSINRLLDEVKNG